jgi:anti-sigma regulatory factor (Ser/Thr protein kinase)
MLHLAIPARLAAIDDARAWATVHARTAGLSDDELAELELAITEALANVIKHGYQREADVLIDIEATIEADRLEICILDRAPAFMPGDLPPRDLNYVSEGGYGLSLIESLTDEVRREPRRGGGNALTLVMMLKGRPNG